MKLVCNSHTYTDKVASLVQEAANLQASLGSHEGDAASIPVSHIDGEHFIGGISELWLPSITVSPFLQPDHVFQMF